MNSFYSCYEMLVHYTSLTGFQQGWWDKLTLQSIQIGFLQGIWTTLAKTISIGKLSDILYSIQINMRYLKVKIL